MNIKSIFCLLSVLCLLNGLSAQTSLSWELLAQVTHKPYYNIGSGDAFDKPKFSKAVQKMEGKEVTIKGYIIPLDAKGNTYILSANPNSACFFCGGAGPESVMELWLEDTNRRYKMDQVLTFKGTLAVNSEPYGLYYLLQHAEPVE
jgi:hypothetical protein